jgi:type IV secretion system protein VirB8
MNLFRKNPEESDLDKSPAEQESKLHGDALEWEAQRIFMIEKSERKAWYIAYAAFGVLALSWMAIVLMLPLNREKPYMVRVDNITGAVEIVTTLNDKRVTYDDIIDKYWIAKFVRAREKYDWYTLQNDYKEVGMLSTSEVGKEYAALFDGSDAMHKVYSKQFRVVVDVLSVVPTGNGTATVRIAKTIERLDANPADGSKSKNVKKYIATVGYEYRNPSKISESLRLVNPLGFQAKSYRLDPELVSTPNERQQTIEPPPPEEPQDDIGGLGQ